MTRKYRTKTSTGSLDVVKRRYSALTIVIALAVFSGVSDIYAHGNKWSGVTAGFGAGASSGGYAFIEVKDTKKDGHCAIGRIYYNGRWRGVATDCNHGSGTFVASRRYPISRGSRVAMSVCLGSHTGNGDQGCIYQVIRVPRSGATYLGAFNYPDEGY